MNPALRIWLLTALVYGAVAALLIFVLIPAAYNAGLLAARPGWDLTSYQRAALPRAVIGFFLLGGVLTYARRYAERSRPGGAGAAPRH